MDYTDITDKLGISSSTPREKIIFELNKLKSKKRNTWRKLHLTEHDFKAFDIEI
jgi:hypothetical protein